MKTYCWILIIGLFLFSSGCKNETETVVSESKSESKGEGRGVALATYKGGTITESDFLKWMQAKHFGERKISNILYNPKKRHGHLRRFSLEKLTSKEAEKAGYERTEDFKGVIKSTKTNYIIRCLRKKALNEAEFKEDCVKVKMIEFKVKDYKLVDGVKKIKLPEAELEERFKQKMDIAKIVIEELNKGGDFEELAEEYSDHHSKRKGGDVGYVFRDMEYPVIAEDAFSLQVGEYSKKPLRKSTGLYIIKVEDKKEISNGNILGVITDENEARALAMRLRARAALELENDLAFADDADSYFNKISGQDTNTVLFEIGGRPFTIADFDKEIAGLDDDGKGAMFREQLGRHGALLLREAFIRGIHRDPEFVEGWKIIRDATLGAAYKNGVILALSEMEVTKEEIDMEYNRRKKADDTKKLSRDDVVKILKGKKRFAKKLNWEEELLINNEVRIADLEL